MTYKIKLNPKAVTKNTNCLTFKVSLEELIETGNQWLFWYLSELSIEQLLNFQTNKTYTIQPHSMNTWWIKIEKQEQA